MRIISGVWGGRPLDAPKGPATRPTSDRVREALFSILGDVEQWDVLDLFAGTGAVGLEALSRGARSAVAVEKGRPALAALKRNVDRLGAELEVRAEDALRFAAQCERSFDFVYVDPPWPDSARVESELAEHAARLLVEDGWMVIERSSRSKPPAPYPGLEPPRLRKYGEAHLAVYRRG